MAIKLRIGASSLERRAAALALFNKLVAESFTVLGATGGQFHAAVKSAYQHALGLRAGDALPLAVASEHGATLFTLDQRLADPGPALGVPARLPAWTVPTAFARLPHASGESDRPLADSGGSRPSIPR